MSASLRVRLCHREDATTAAVAARRFSLAAGLDRLASNEVALAAMELAANAVRHGGGGELELLQEGNGVTVRVVDDGPGMPSPETLFTQQPRDPNMVWTPGTTLGAGGAAVRRLMDSVVAVARVQGGLEVRATKLLVRGNTHHRC
ncbi:MAG: ATP-binding protein [Myxococcota bacterium]